MEALQHTLGSGWDDLGSVAVQSGDVLGWLPPSRRSTGSSESTVASSTGSTSGGSESGKVTPLPPQILSLLQSTIGSSESGDTEQRSFDNRCIMNLVKTYFPAPPPPPPAREVSLKKPKYFLTSSPNAVLKESKKLAKGALEHYNKKKKIKFELLDVIPVIMMSESGRLYHTLTSPQSPKKRVPRNRFSLLSFTTVAKDARQVASLSHVVNHWVLTLLWDIMGSSLTEAPR